MVFKQGEKVTVFDYVYRLLRGDFENELSLFGAVKSDPEVWGNLLLMLWKIQIPDNKQNEICGLIMKNVGEFRCNNQLVKMALGIFEKNLPPSFIGDIRKLCGIAITGSREADRILAGFNDLREKLEEL